MGALFVLAALFVVICVIYPAVMFFFWIDERRNGSREKFSDYINF